MLLQFQLENFKSIHEQAVFSMIASEDLSHVNYLRKMNPFQVLPSTIIVGTNGAGKSNLFQAVKYLQDLLKGDYKERFPFHPHKLNENNKGTKIDLQIMIDDKRYAYGITLNQQAVMSEYLFQVVDGEEGVVFERDHNKMMYIHDDYFEDIEPNKIALTHIKENYTDQDAEAVYDFLMHKILVVLTEGNDEASLFKQAIEHFKNEQNQEIVETLIERLNIGIRGFDLKDDTILVRYDNMEINLLEESTGNKKLFMLLTLISDVINDGKVIFFDELEKNLHIMLVKYIIKMFNLSKTNKENAQLIFSAHNTALLNLSLFRRDQVWLMEKNFETLNTELYSLYSILDVLESENIEYGYISGKYGATFKINLDEVVGYGK